MGYYATHTIKVRILSGVAFDYSGADGSRAVRELKAEGYVIKKDRKTGMYRCLGKGSSTTGKREE